MTPKILTVDDSKTIRMIVKKAFKSYDCELIEAENGQDGLALASREKPDLIILDITMPVMTGVEMLEKMQADPHLKEIPVIMLTAESGKDNVMTIVKMGVKDYICQYMFETPPHSSNRMDLAKALAQAELAESFVDDSFRIWRQTRIGLLSHPLDPEAARGHLAAATYLQMALRPHIIHVVGHTEAHHAATAADVIAACKVARRAIENALRGAPDMTCDSRVQERKQELVAEARVTLDAILALAGTEVTDPLIDPPTLARAVSIGLLDAPHLKANRFARGQILTTIDQRGACVALDPKAGHPLSERQRIAQLRH